MYLFCNSDFNLCICNSNQRLGAAVKPAPEWGPALDEDRAAAGYPPFPTREIKEIASSKEYNNSAFIGDLPPSYSHDNVFGLDSVGVDNIDIEKQVK